MAPEDQPYDMQTIFLLVCGVLLSLLASRISQDAVLQNWNSVEFLEWLTG